MWIVVWLLLPVVMAVGCGGAEAENPPGKPAPLAERASLDGIHSGEAEVSLDVTDSATDEPVHMRSRALFLGVGREDPPQFDMTIESHGELDGRKVGFFGAFLLLANRAVLYYRGQMYRPPGSAFGRLKSKFKRAQRKVDAGNPMACVEALKGERVVQLFHGFRSEGHRREHDGTPVTLIGAEFDAGQAADALIRMASNPACETQLEALGLPTDPQLQSVAVEAVKSAEAGHVQLAVDKRSLLRELSIEVTATVPGGDQYEVEFTWLLEDANGLKELPHPTADAQLPALLGQFGTDLPTVQAASSNQLLVGLLEPIAKAMTGR
jgi:hypothetical protein